MRYGTECDFECRPGYSLVGKSMLMCSRKGQWTNSFPVCKGTIFLKYIQIFILLQNYKAHIKCLIVRFKFFSCLQHPALKENMYHCTDDCNDGSKCHRICPDGYDMTAGKPRVILCHDRWMSYKMDRSNEGVYCMRGSRGGGGSRGAGGPPPPPPFPKQLLF